MIRKELTLVSHRIEHLDEYQSHMENKNKKENLVLQVKTKSPLSRHTEVRRRIGFDTTEIPELNSVTESDSSSRVWTMYSPNQWNYATPDNPANAQQQQQQQQQQLQQLSRSNSSNNNTFGSRPGDDQFGNSSSSSWNT